MLDNHTIPRLIYEFYLKVLYAIGVPNAQYTWNPMIKNAATMETHDDHSLHMGSHFLANPYSAINLTAPELKFALQTALHN